MQPGPGVTRLGGRPAVVVGHRENTLISIQRWIDSPPPFGRLFDKAAQITLAANAGLTDIVAFRLPVNYIGVLRFFGNQVGASDTAFVTFSLFVNGSPVTGYVNMIGLKSPGLTSPDPLVAAITGGGRVVVQASNSSGSSVQNIGARIKGWFWSAAQELEWAAAGGGH